VSTFRKLVKILLFVFVVNAMYQFVPPYYRYVRFKDGVHETALFSQRVPDTAIVDRVMTLVDRLNVPVARESVFVQHEGARIVISVSYVETMTFVPGRPYEWQFDASADALHVRNPKEAP